MGCKLNVDLPVVTTPADIPQGYVALTDRWNSKGPEYQRVRRGIAHKRVRAIKLIITSRNQTTYVHEGDAEAWISCQDGRCKKSQSEPVNAGSFDMDRLLAIAERIAIAVEELATKPPRLAVRGHDGQEADCRRAE